MARVSNLIRTALQKHVADFPTKTAFRSTHQGIRWNFAELSHQSLAVASGLVDLGVHAGESVGLSLGRGAELVTLSLGASMAGYNIAAASCGLSAKGMTKMLEEQRCKILIVDAHSVPAALEALAGSTFPDLEYILHTGQHKEAGGLIRFSDILLYNPLPDRLAALEVGDGSRFLVDVGNNGIAGKNLSISDAMKEAEVKADRLKLSNISSVLYGSKDGSAADVVLSSIACISKLSKFVIPSESFNEASLKVATSQDKCDITIN